MSTAKLGTGARPGANDACNGRGCDQFARISVGDRDASPRLTSTSWAHEAGEPAERRALEALSAARQSCYGNATLKIELGAIRSMRNLIVPKIAQRFASRRSAARLAPFFDRKFYLVTNPDVRRLNIDPLHHYLEHGWCELRDPNPQFSVEAYLARYHDQLAPGENPLAHFVRQQRHRVVHADPSRLAGPYRDVLTISAEFDEEYYLASYEDVNLAGEDPLLHFAKIGWQEGRNPCPWFSTQFYLNKYVDVAHAKVNPFAHFITYGRNEGRMPMYPTATKIAFGTYASKNIKNNIERISVYTLKHDHIRFIDDDTLMLRISYALLLREAGLFNDGFYRKKYLSAYPEVAPLQHYVLIGSAAGFLPNPFFDPNTYLAVNEGVRESGLDPVIHYAYFGTAEGRKISAPFDSDAYLQQHPELRGSSISPLQHVIMSAEREHFDPTLRSPACAPAPSAANKVVAPNGLRSSGTILLVTHDLEIGGAQALIRALAKWLLAATKYDVRFVALRGGADAHRFTEIAPVFDIAGHAEMHEVPAARTLLRDFIPADLKLVLINSVASGAFLDWWDGQQPVISYIHELQKMITEHGDNIVRLAERSSFVLGGSEAVTTLLRSEHLIEADKCRLVPDFMHDLDHRPQNDAQRDGIRRKYGAPHGAVVLVGCGVAHWRKAPDLFVEVAAKVRRSSSRQVYFIWIGGGPDLDECRSQAVELGVSDIVNFVGFSNEAEAIIGSSDVFMLPSLEDPFPLVCIHAALNGLPIVCFEEAGGVPAFVAQGAGVATPFKNTDAMAAAAVRYVEDVALRRQAGERGRILAKNHLVSATGPMLLALIKQATGEPPHVSVVVPNYNYEKFLSQRLDTIYRQTFQDFEVILLDDASIDNSIDLLREAANHASTRLHVNDRNSGSPFAQWLKGLGLARGGLIWIAEADDFSDPEFLQRAIPHFDDENIFVTYALSTPIDDNGKQLGDYRPLYLDRINRGRWDRSYSATDQQEIESCLAIANTIPNASSVVFRKFEYDDDLKKMLLSMKLCGDWLFYVHALKGGKIQYLADPLNFHRRHEATVTSRVEGQGLYFSEAARVRAYIQYAFRLPSATIQKAREFWRGDIERFAKKPGFDKNTALAETPYEARDGEGRRSLLVVTSDFSPGGGQLFAIRLANEWSRRGGRAFIASADYLPEHPAVLRMIDPHVARFRVGGNKRTLRNIIRDFKIEMIHSSIWWADKAVFEALNGWETHVPWIVTMHGCYETLLSDPNIDPDFPATVAAMKPLVSEWVYIADKHRDVLRKLRMGDCHAKINNGVPPPHSRALSRDSLGVRPNALLVCIASRAIESKGWREAIAAVELLNQRGRAVDLLLIGEGPLYDELTRRGNLPPYVRLVGQVSNVADYIAASDVGLLPTTFIGESMPLVLIDFFAAGKPVVATSAGDIPAMIDGEGGPAGRIVPLSNGRVSVSDIADALQAFFDPELRRACGRIGLRNFETRYTIEIMCDAYENIYQAAYDQRSASPTRPA
ncbi:MAG: glycosyltransferase [Rhodoblastus sp.]